MSRERMAFPAGVVGQFEADERAHAVPEQSIGAVRPRLQPPPHLFDEGPHPAERRLAYPGLSPWKLDGTEVEAWWGSAAPLSVEGGPSTCERKAEEADGGRHARLAERIPRIPAHDDAVIRLLFAISVRLRAPPPRRCEQFSHRWCLSWGKLFPIEPVLRPPRTAVWPRAPGGSETASRHFSRAACCRTRRSSRTRGSDDLASPLRGRG